MPASAYFRLGRVALGLMLASPMATATVAQGAPSQALRRLGAADVDSMTLQQPGRRIAYGSDSLHFGELRLPPGVRAGTRVPVAGVIHGGCWISSFASLRNTAAMADALADAGIATWNVEYRRVDHPGGGWPGTLVDVARATDYLRTLAREFPLDTNRVVAVGHSAGGQLALWLASRAKLPAQSPFGDAVPLSIYGVVSLGGVTDLEEFATRIPGGCGRGASLLLGGDPRTLPDRVLLASPVRRLPLGIPTTHIAGEQDGIAPDSVRNAFRRAAITAGDPPPLNITVPGGHFEVIAPRTPAGAVVVRQTRTMLGLTPP
ncbi:alpha/beta hydrolase [Gemmatimonas sp.]